MQDLIHDYASDLKKLREVFHKELVATADELSKAMAVYAQRSEAALASFMEKASARGLELEVSAAARLSQFCGLPANSFQPDLDNKPFVHTPNANVFGIVVMAKREAVARIQPAVVGQAAFFTFTNLQHSKTPFLFQKVNVR